MHNGWLSGKVLYLRSRGCGFEPHRGRYVVSLSMTRYPLHRTGSTREVKSRHDCKIVDRDIKNRSKQQK